MTADTLVAKSSRSHRIIRRGCELCIALRTRRFRRVRNAKATSGDCRRKVMPMEITYSQVGDYLLPNIILNEPPPEITAPIGRYGQLRQKFLREHRRTYSSTLLLSEQLYHHLREVDAIARERKRRGVPEEIILAEIIYKLSAFSSSASFNRCPACFYPCSCTPHTGSYK